MSERARPLVHQNYRGASMANADGVRVTARDDQPTGEMSDELRSWLEAWYDNLLEGAGVTDRQFKSAVDELQQVIEAEVQQQRGASHGER